MSKLTKTLLLVAAVAALCLVSFGIGSLLGKKQTALSGITDIVNGVLLAKEGVISGDLRSFTKVVRLESASSTAQFTNRTGKDLFLYNGELSIVATSSAPGSIAVASSSYRAFLIASSTQNRPDLYALPVGASSASSSVLINAFAIATSTQATTTSMFDALVGSAAKVHRIPDGGTVFLLMQTTCPASAPASNVCLAATSTQRGFDVQMKLFLHE